MINKRSFKILLLIPLLLAVQFNTFFSSAQDVRTDRASHVMELAQGIIRWKKADNGSAPDGFLINNTFLELAGTTPGDWFPIGLGRLGIEDDYSGYLAVIKQVVQNRYLEPSKLSAAKATEWHRISLAILAMGGDPTSFGIDDNGQPIDLIADGTYDRGKTTSLGRQGINGYIWGLIVLDSMRYAVPQNAFYSRDDILIEILRQQLPDGGFTLTGQTADPDITAMALQALAPYYNSEKIYTYPQRAFGKEVSKTARSVVDEALQCLSALQLDTGDFLSWGTQNVESTDQVICALCALGIDPLNDPRFIKNGNTLLDGVLRYRMEDGGFVHSFTYDPENPTSHPDRSNTMASEQTLYTLTALWRYYSGMRSLYDFRPEQDSSLKQRITTLRSGIAEIGTESTAAQLKKLLVTYYELPQAEREYVYNYPTLSDAARHAGLDIEAVAGKTEIVESPPEFQEQPPLTYFSEADRSAVEALPDHLTTEYYVTVTKLLDKLEQSEEFEGMETYLSELTEANDQIADIQSEIDRLNVDVLSQLYPLEKMTLREKSTVDAVVARYEALSEFDRSKIHRWEDVIKTKTKIDNQLRALFIAITTVLIGTVLAVIVFRRIRRRRLAKRRAMEELAAQYEERP